MKKRNVQVLERGNIVAARNNAGKLRIRIFVRNIGEEYCVIQNAKGDNILCHISRVWKLIGSFPVHKNYFQRGDNVYHITEKTRAVVVSGSYDQGFEIQLSDHRHIFSWGDLLNPFPWDEPIPIDPVRKKGDRVIVIKEFDGKILEQYTATVKDAYYHADMLYYLLQKDSGEEVRVSYALVIPEMD